MYYKASSIERSFIINNRRNTTILRKQLSGFRATLCTEKNDKFANKTSQFSQAMIFSSTRILQQLYLKNINIDNCFLRWNYSTTLRIIMLINM